MQRDIKSFEAFRYEIMVSYGWQGIGEGHRKEGENYFNVLDKLHHILTEARDKIAPQGTIQVGPGMFLKTYRLDIDHRAYTKLVSNSTSSIENLQQSILRFEAAIQRNDEDLIKSGRDNLEKQLKTAQKIINKYEEIKQKETIKKKEDTRKAEKEKAPPEQKEKKEMKDKKSKDLAHAEKRPSFFSDVASVEKKAHADLTAWFEKYNSADSFAYEILKQFGEQAVNTKHQDIRTTYFEKINRLYAHINKKNKEVRKFTGNLDDLIVRLKEIDDLINILKSLQNTIFEFEKSSILKHGDPYAAQSLRVQYDGDLANKLDVLKCKCNDAEEVISGRRPTSSKKI